MKKRRKIQLFLLDLLYPNQCPCCHRKIPWNRYLCDMCQTLFQLPPDTFCPGCGKPVESCFCERGPAYDHAIAAALYQEPARSGILSLKRAESKNFAYACGEVLGRMVIADPELLAYDLIVPVPMAKRKKKKRFFNPAEEIAREMSSATGIPLRADLLEILSGNGSLDRCRGSDIHEYRRLDIAVHGFHVGALRSSFHFQNFIHNAFHPFS